MKRCRTPVLPGQMTADDVINAINYMQANMKPTPKKSTLDLAKTSTGKQDTRLNNAPAKPPVDGWRNPHARVPAVPATRESDDRVAAMYPTLGDAVMINLERVDRMRRKPAHVFVETHGLHGKYGAVVGAQVTGGIYMLQVDTGDALAWIPADAVEHSSLPPSHGTPMQEPRISPEKMRKPRSGAYNKT